MDGRSSRRAVWTCYGAMMCLAIAVNLPPVFLTTFGHAFGLSDEQLGRIPSVVFAGVVVGILASGPLADRWGAKPFAMLGAALLGAGLAVMGAAHSYATVLVSGCLMGLGAGVLDMVLSPIVCALEPHRRATAMNWLHSFYCTGAVCTVLVGSATLHLGLPWRAVAGALVAVPAVVCVGFARLRVPPLVDSRTRRDPMPRLFRRPEFLAALVGMALAGATEQGMAQWLPAFAERAKGCSKTAAGMVLAGFLVAMVLGRLLGAAIGNRVRPIVLLLVSCALSALLIVVSCFAPSVPVALSAAMAMGMAVSCLWPTLLGHTADRFPAGGGSMFGLLAASGNAGCFAMPWIVGVLADATGRLDWALASTLLCPILMAAVLLYLATRPAATSRMQNGERPTATPAVPLPDP